ncbi:MAG: metallophosphoesterase family protein [Parvularculaceae bacterium]|nr:metallophosphoesterase family protein [Parvularculaceae bacterium]
MKRPARLAATIIALCTADHAVAANGPHAPSAPYAAKSLPDRIVLSPGADPARSMGVAFRTDAAQATTEVELAVAVDSPTLERAAKKIGGVASPIETTNGKAIYHQARFEGLSPETVYAYRVKGAAGWSEWLQFRTASASPKPFAFLYFGDTQNGILSLGARVIRQAFQSTAGPALAVHAGDLVAQRDDMDHDDEWGEWTATGGYAFASVPQAPAPGNHEYTDDDLGPRVIGPHWTRQFALPRNGAKGAEATTYAFDYQGVRFVMLDGTKAVELGGVKAQTAWADKVLAEPGPLWRVVVVHQPLYTCARPKDTEILRDSWAALFEKRRVDLVLQGHDHCYGRWTDVRGKAKGAEARAKGEPQGPVYMVSVTGKKMYGLNDRASWQPDRAGEDTQLYQVVRVETNRVTVESRTATGRLYDGFSLSRGADGRNRLTEMTEGLIAPRVCSGGTGPDGAPCTASAK